jgi:hypothetical protein
MIGCVIAGEAVSKRLSLARSLYHISGRRSAPNPAYQPSYLATLALMRIELGVGKRIWQIEHFQAKWEPVRRPEMRTRKSVAPRQQVFEE